MTTASLWIALLSVLILPPYLLLRKNQILKWGTRYFLAVLPALYTGAGWKFSQFTYDFFGCRGSSKSLHACVFHGINITQFADYGFFLMIPFLFVALPLSVFLLKLTSRQHIDEVEQNDLEAR